MASVKFMTTGAVAVEDFSAATLAAASIKDGKTVLIDDVEWVCTNETTDCCQDQAADPTATTATCWDQKPVPKATEQLTTELAAAMTAGTLDSCIPWTSGYNWKVGEQACDAVAQKMYKCEDPAFCMLLKPTDTAIFDVLAAVGAVTGDISSVWAERTGVTMAKEDPSDPKNCYAGWEEGKKYKKGATLCDGIVYECIMPSECGYMVPGTSASATVWLDKSTGDDAIEVPASQEKDYDYYSRANDYVYGDFCVNKVD